AETTIAITSSFFMAWLLLNDDWLKFRFDGDLLDSDLTGRIQKIHGETKIGFLLAVYENARIWALTTVLRHPGNDLLPRHQAFLPSEVPIRQYRDDNRLWLLIRDRSLGDRQVHIDPL